MLTKLIVATALVAVAQAEGLYSASLLAAPAIKYAPIASSYQYETRVHSAPTAYATKIAAPLAHAAPIHKKVAPLAFTAPIHKVTAPFAYAAPTVSVTHHSYAAAPYLAAPKPYGGSLVYVAGPALW
ncbi:hypothetical protein BIW11_12832 [Tropilaelaps mercedesae]|uniref:Cuticle protein 16.5-like n=1 Tax=Tropilaelaps mercedesae TaxID=418985 RepID=A0A1V9X4Q6_9ACAR|nr:hypothetical protein BIW11_12832 [Tropilaelaps mercedesae]